MLRCCFKLPPWNFKRQKEAVSIIPQNSRNKSTLSKEISEVRHDSVLKEQEVMRSFPKLIPSLRNILTKTGIFSRLNRSGSDSGFEEPSSQLLKSVGRHIEDDPYSPAADVHGHCDKGDVDLDDDAKLKLAIECQEILHSTLHRCGGNETWPAVLTIVTFASLKLEVYVQESHVKTLEDAVNDELQSSVPLDMYTVYRERVEVIATPALEFKAESMIGTGSSLLYFDGSDMRGVNLTMLMSDGHWTYAISTTHMRNLTHTGNNVMYYRLEPSMPYEPLGEVVSYASLSVPFTEACLIKIKPCKMARVQNRCPFIEKPIKSIHVGKVSPYNIVIVNGEKDHQLGVVQGPCGTFSDPMRGGKVIRDFIPCIGIGNAPLGGKGVCGSPVINLSYPGRDQILSSHVGRIQIPDRVGNGLNSIAVTQRMDNVVKELERGLGKRLFVFQPGIDIHESTQVDVHQAATSNQDHPFPGTGSDGASGRLYDEMPHNNHIVEESAGVRFLAVGNLDGNPRRINNPSKNLYVAHSDSLVKEKSGEGRKGGQGELVRDDQCIKTCGPSKGCHSSLGDILEEGVGTKENSMYLRSGCRPKRATRDRRVTL